MQRIGAASLDSRLAEIEAGLHLLGEARERVERRIGQVDVKADSGLLRRFRETLRACAAGIRAGWGERFASCWQAFSEHREAVRFVVDHILPDAGLVSEIPEALEGCSRAFLFACSPASRPANSRSRWETMTRLAVSRAIWSGKARRWPRGSRTPWPGRSRSSGLASGTSLSFGTPASVTLGFEATGT